MITSPANADVKLIRSLAADRKERRRERLFVLEGVRLVTDALLSDAQFTRILYAPAALVATPEGQDLAARLAAHPAARVADTRVVAIASDTTTPQGVVGIARWPQPTPATGGILLVIDALQDPGNVGTLLRSAEAAGAAQVLCSAGTVDAYAPKTVRAGMGAQLRLAIQQDLAWEAIDTILQQCTQVYAAAAGAALAHYTADWRGHVALIIGSEAHGLSAAARQRATPIGIPMQGGTESLNAGVAGSIVLFEALRQRSFAMRSAE